MTWLVEFANVKELVKVMTKKYDQWTRVNSCFPY